MRKTKLYRSQKWFSKIYKSLVGSTLRNSLGGGGGLPPVSPNPDVCRPIVQILCLYLQTMSFSIPFCRPGFQKLYSVCEPIPLSRWSEHLILVALCKKLEMDGRRRSKPTISIIIKNNNNDGNNNKIPVNGF